MALENIPWSLTGGIVSASLARMLAYQATGGEEGVAGIGDMLVRQLATAGTSIRISNGGVVMNSRYPGVKNESYMARAGDETVVPYPANNTGATRYDLVICRIDDWNFAGQQSPPATLPTNAVAASKFQVITGVPAGTTRFAQLGLAYPAIALARVAVPANTSTITQAFITSVREKAVPRRKRDLRAIAQTGGRDNSITTGGERFPDNGLFDVEVPTWATRVRIVANWGSLLAPAGTVYANVWIRFADQSANVVIGQKSVIDLTSARNDPSRVVGMTADDLAVPAAVRGTTVKVAMMGGRLGGTANLKADAFTCISVDMEFLEAPTEDL